MKDLMFDFSENDVAVRNGDFAVTEDASRQNGGLILMKNPVNVFLAQYGVGFEAWSPQVSVTFARNLISEARKQILDDGAVRVEVSIDQGGNLGDMTVNLKTEY